MDSFRVTPQQVKFFRTFGYLVLPGLFREEIGEILAAFEEVFVRAGIDHRGSERSALIQFVDRHERLRAVLDARLGLEPAQETRRLHLRLLAQP